MLSKIELEWAVFEWFSDLKTFLSSFWLIYSSTMFSFRHVMWYQLFTMCQAFRVWFQMNSNYLKTFFSVLQKLFLRLRRSKISVLNIFDEFFTMFENETRVDVKPATFPLLLIWIHVDDDNNKGTEKWKRRKKAFKDFERFHHGGEKVEKEKGKRKMKSLPWGIGSAVKLEKPKMGNMRPS